MGLYGRKGWCSVFGFLCISPMAWADTQHDFQTWLNLTVTGYFNKGHKSFGHLKYWLESQERIGDDSKRLTQSLIRQALGHAFTSNLSLWVGYAWVHTSFPFTTRPFDEDRAWEQLLWTHQLKKWKLTSRTRLEQRFLSNNKNVAYRAREMLKFAKPFKRAPQWSFVIADELFWHKNDFIGKNGKGFDQNRFFIGYAYQFKKNSSLEFGYMNQYIRRFGVPNFQTNILAINFSVNF